MINFIDAAAQICLEPGGNASNVGDIVNLVAKIVAIFQIAIPIILIVMGLISLGKAVVSSKDDEIKKATTGLVKKIILAVAIFFVVVIVKLIIGLVSNSTSSSMSKCWDIISNPRWNK